MRKIFLGFVLLFMSFAIIAGQQEVESQFSIAKTAERYVQALQASGVPVFQRQTKKNRFTGKEELIVFGNPYFGSNIMCNKALRKDKPLTARVWKNGEGRVLLEYTLPSVFINEFGVIECGHEVDNMNRVLNGFADSAVK